MHVARTFLSQRPEFAERQARFDVVAFDGRGGSHLRPRRETRLAAVAFDAERAMNKP